MKGMYSVRFIWTVLFAFSLFQFSTTCWGLGSTGLGESTVDFDLLAGSELVIDCLLHPETNMPANSSYLVFKKNGDSRMFSDYTHIINSNKAQLRLPHAVVEDSGMYHCQLATPDNPKPTQVCVTNVYVGHPPKNVSNFNCISRNFENLTCTWDIEPNRVRTNYSLQKTFVFQNVMQKCPEPNNTYCQWRNDTEPAYQPINENLTLFLYGNNSLGAIEMEFKYDHFSIVIPNRPDKLIASEVGKKSLTMAWSPPRMTSAVDRPALAFQLWLEELEESAKDRIVLDVGVEMFSFTFHDLLPNFRYNVSIRCRSNFTTSENMWSPLASVTAKTLPEVPEWVPEVHRDAFLVQNFGNYRNVTLYWKPVPKRHHNGEGFHYRVLFSGGAHTGAVSSPLLSAVVGFLRSDLTYTFRVHSANTEGASEAFGTVVVDDRSRVGPPVKHLRAISLEEGRYNLSWSDAGRDARYTVFHCEGRKPSRCERPIEWSSPLAGTDSFALVVLEGTASHQFAVAATVGGRSSGMQWASCIVANKAPLGQIPITHVAASSTSLDVFWKLDCEAQKSVIDRYVLTYCRESCKDVEIESNAVNYTVTGLQPFSNYSVKLRAFNKENKPSEDVDAVYQTTQDGAPSGPPENVSADALPGGSILVRWKPPSVPNGNISHYDLYCNGLPLDRVRGPCDPCQFAVQGLKLFTLYNVSVRACVRESCSAKSSPVSVVTDVGAPGPMDPPRIEPGNGTHLKLLWTPPALANGPLDAFEVRWQEERGNRTVRRRIVEDRGASVFVEFECSTFPDGGITHLFSVRAANRKDGTLLFGPFSNPSKGTACVMSQGLAMVIGIAIGGTLAFAFFLCIVYKLVRWMSEKIHQVKNIAVRLPKELEGPETNPLNSYGGFRNGVSHDAKAAAATDSENKNRHGSGGSQSSGASTDELIFKNGKCTKFGRKPSGDSSGCSSMSSRTTTRVQLSSDSGTESDFPIPSSPDSALVEPPARPPLPVLAECSKPRAADEPRAYSKFGATPPPSLYSSHLANSEPSVCDAATTLAAPYSKVGLAKSSGHLLVGRKELGYSRFGQRERRTSTGCAENVAGGNANPESCGRNPSPGYVSLGDLRSTHASLPSPLSTSGGSLDAPFQLPDDLADLVDPEWSRPLDARRDGSFETGILAVVANPGRESNGAPFLEGVSAERTVQPQNARGVLPEILLTPSTVRNGYVPFSTACEPRASRVPNVVESKVPHSVFPSDACADLEQNYITPDKKRTLKVLQEEFISNNNALWLCDSSGGHSANSHLRYVLKPLPKMESEICEV